MLSHFKNSNGWAHGELGRLCRRPGWTCALQVQFQCELDPPLGREMKRSERVVASIVHWALAASPAGPRPLMLDIGANAGYYGLLAISLGARAIFFEPQPVCCDWIEQSLGANAWGQDRGAVIRSAIAASESPRSFRVGHDCNGGFSLLSRHQLSRSQGTAAGYVFPRSLASLQLPEFVADAPVGSIALVKVDVEHFEIPLLRFNLVPLLRRRLIRHLVVEITPFLWHKAARKPQAAAFADGLSMVSEVASFGYTVYSPRWRGALPLAERSFNLSHHVGSIPRNVKWNGQEDLHFALEDGAPEAQAVAEARKMTHCCTHLDCACSISQTVLK